LLTRPQVKKQLHVPDTAGSASPFLPSATSEAQQEKNRRGALTRQDPESSKM
jgi:hypothetical protein